VFHSGRLLPYPKTLNNTVLKRIAKGEHSSLLQLIAVKRFKTLAHDRRTDLTWKSTLALYDAELITVAK